MEVDKHALHQCLTSIQKFLRHGLLSLQKQTTVKKTTEIFKQHIDDSVKYRKHPGGILNFMRVWLYIAMVEGTAIVHVNFVVIFQVIYQIWNVTSNCAFRSSIWTTIRPKLAL